MHLTTKQSELLRVICGGPCDLDEILDSVRYDTTKQSLQFSLRALVGHKLINKLGIQKRRGRQRQVIEATLLAMQVMGLAQKPSSPMMVASVEEDKFDADVEYLSS